jgi:hypothetical protein
MEINFTSCQVQGCSNGSIYHYKLEPAVVTDILDEDSEINTLLQKKEYRKRRVAMFKLLQECVIKSIHAKVCQHLIMISRPQGQLYLPMCLSGKTLPECTTINDDDLIVVYCGSSNSGLSYDSILYLQEVIYATTRYCEVVTHDTTNQYQYSHVKLIVHEQPSTREIDDQNNAMKEHIIQLEEANNKLMGMIAKLQGNNAELQDVISQLTQKQSQVCCEETEFFRIEDTVPIIKDPFTLDITTTSRSECKQCQSPLESSQGCISLAAKAALQREKQFMQSAYGKRVINVLKKR